MEGLYKRYKEINIMLAYAALSLKEYNEYTKEKQEIEKIVSERNDQQWLINTT